MAFISAFIYLLAFSLLIKVDYSDNTFLLSVAQNTLDFLLIFHSINVGLAIFNLIPIPPLDGSRILNVVLPTKVYFGIMKYERIIYFVLIGWLLLGGYVADALLSIPTVSANPILSGLASVFALSDLLSMAFSKISDLMFSFWELFPFL